MPRTLDVPCSHLLSYCVSSPFWRARIEGLALEGCAEGAQQGWSARSPSPLCPTQPVLGAAHATGAVPEVCLGPSCHRHPPLPLPRLAEAPGEAGAAAVQALSRRLLGLASDPARDPDPSVYLALRLAADHDLAAEQRYLARLQDTFQRRYNQYVPRGSLPCASRACPLCPALPWQPADTECPQDPAGSCPVPRTPFQGRHGLQEQQVSVGAPVCLSRMCPFHQQGDSCPLGRGDLSWHGGLQG